MGIIAVLNDDILFQSGDIRDHCREVVRNRAENLMFLGHRFFSGRDPQIFDVHL